MEKKIARAILISFLLALIGLLIRFVGLKVFIVMVLYVLFAACFSRGLVYLLEKSGWLP